MVLLTGGQVSMAISSGIVIFFTILLFLAGYVLQQQTVQSLQIAIRPRIPVPLAPPSNSFSQNPLSKGARLPGESVDIDAELQHYLDMVGKGGANWAKLAHVQLVKSHAEVCTAVMFFAELKRLKSPARRVLMFPASWTKDMSEADAPELARTRRLLRTAARRYGVGLSPVRALSKSNGDVDDSVPASYSLTSLWAFGDEFERVLYVQSPGLLLDSEPLDGLLAFAPAKRLAARGMMGKSKEEEISTQLLLVTPSIETWNQLKELRSQQTISDINLLRKAFKADDVVLQPSTYFAPSIFADTAALRLPQKEFNATSFLDQTAYIRFTDPEIPGPEYDIPYVERANYRPEDEGPRVVWERLYEVFRQRRMDVCGLDLEHWRGPKYSPASEDEDDVDVQGAIAEEADGNTELLQSAELLVEQEL